MQNLLTLIRAAITDYKHKKEVEYSKKVDFIRQQTYLYYLSKNLNKNCSVDLPYFLYRGGAVVNLTARDLTNIAMFITLKKGRRHVDKCYKRCVKEFKKNSKNNK